MRLLKIYSIVFFTIFIIVTLTYSARISIISHFAKTQLGLAQLKVTCLDVSVDSNIAIVVDKLCLKGPKAHIEIDDMVIQWQYFPYFKITEVDVGLVEVKGTAHLFASSRTSPQSNETSNSSQNLSDLLITTLQPYAEQIKLFQLPTKLNINELIYRPFSVVDEFAHSKNTIQPQPEKQYIASLLAEDNVTSFSLKNEKGVEFIKTKLIQEKSGFSITVSSELNLLKNFATVHQLPITAKLQRIFNTNEFSGSLDSTMVYGADFFSLQNKITNFEIDFEQGINRSGAFKFSGDLNFKTQLTLPVIESNKKLTEERPEQVQNEIVLTFIGKNEVFLEYSPRPLFKFLKESKADPAIITILQDNPLSHLAFKVQSNETLTLKNDHLYLSHIELSALNDEITHQIKLDEIALPLNYSTLSVESFNLDSRLDLTSITKLTSAPVDLHLEGSLNTTEEKTDIYFNENSLIATKNIIVIRSPEQKTKPMAKVKALTAKLIGSVQLLKNNDFNIDLSVYKQALNVSLPNILKVKKLDLVSKIKGSFDNIRLDATATADDIHLGEVMITGSLQSPKVKMSAKQLQLTDLLSLNIKLPIKIELIDGILDYSVSGQFSDLSDFDSTVFDASIAIISVSGEFDGIWLQELNWQQKATILAGKITSKSATKNNLTIELIELFTPISKLSVNTNFIFNNVFKVSASNLQANILGGNFFVPNLQWPLEHGHSANVKLSSIDLAQVLALDSKQGIVVTGNISGQLPITFNDEKFIIKMGELHNISDGLIQVVDNPAVAELSANNSQLKVAFDALQNLHYHLLSSSVSMADDGYMQLDTAIKGRNPDIDNEVNLNLNLSYDLLGLLESLLITQRFEKGIIKGLQKNKE